LATRSIPWLKAAIRIGKLRRRDKSRTWLNALSINSSSLWLT